MSLVNHVIWNQMIQTVTSLVDEVIWRHLTQTVMSLVDDVTWLHMTQTVLSLVNDVIWCQMTQTVMSLVDDVIWRHMKQTVTSLFDDVKWGFKLWWHWLMMSCDVTRHKLWHIFGQWHDVTLQTVTSLVDDITRRHVTNCDVISVKQHNFMRPRE